ncbi:MAG TPA: type II toxin-antitoxin system VapC family toxin [Pseudonocardiaceae bacterium]
MTDFVLDASALVALAAMTAPDADLRKRALTGAGAAPELIDVEAVHAVRRLVRRGEMTDEDGRRKVRAIRDAPISRMSHRQLLDRVWELRHAVSAYDAAYVALAERLSVPLLTCDGRLAKAHGHRAEIVHYPRT